jgi:hypothetical protein
MSVDAVRVAGVIDQRDSHAVTFTRLEDRPGYAAVEGRRVVGHATSQADGLAFDGERELLISRGGSAHNPYHSKHNNDRCGERATGGTL